MADWLLYKENLIAAKSFLELSQKLEKGLVATFGDLTQMQAEGVLVSEKVLSSRTITICDLAGNIIKKYTDGESKNEIIKSTLKKGSVAITLYATDKGLKKAGAPTYIMTALETGYIIYSNFNE